MTLVWPPAAIEPLVAEVVSQAAVFTSFQLCVPPLALAMTKLCELGANAPPTGPTAVNPWAGEAVIGWFTCKVTATL